MKTQDKMYSHDLITQKRKFTEFHFHDNYELYYLVDGKTKYFIGDDFFQLHKGNFIFVPKGIIHKTDSEDCLYNERILLSFDDSVFDDVTFPILKELTEDKLFIIQANYLPVLEKILKRIEKEYQSHNKYREIMINNYIKEIVTLICRYKIPHNQVLFGENEFIYAIPQYISNNLSENISLKSLSKHFAFSEGHFSRKFKSVFGVGLNKYVSYIRILNAEKLLTETDLSITEIAEKCGFNDSNYFSTVFKNTLGVSPHKYRKKQERQNV